MEQLKLLHILSAKSQYLLIKDMGRSLSNLAKVSGRLPDEMKEALLTLSGMITAACDHFKPTLDPEEIGETEEEDATDDRDPLNLLYFKGYRATILSDDPKKNKVVLRLEAGNEIKIHVDELDDHEKAILARYRRIESLDESVEKFIRELRYAVNAKIEWQNELKVLIRSRNVNQ